MSNKPKRVETLEEKVSRIRRKAERHAETLAMVLTGAQQEAGAKVKEKAIEVLDAIDELLGDE